MSNLYTRPIGKAETWLREHATFRGADCLIWPLSRDRDGYGHGKIRGHRATRVSIFMCEMAHGPRPSSNHVVSFSCGNGVRGCVNPRHISWMTKGDASRAVRARDVKRPRNYLSGERVREVLLLTKYLSAKKTAELLGMNASYVSQIQQGRYWSPTGEIKGPRNFPKGDPRNPAFRSGRRKTAHEDLTFFQSIVPHGTPGRDDIIAEMYLAYFEGRVTRADLKKRDFVNAFYKKNFEQGGYAVAFDDVAFAIENNRSG